MWMVTTDDKGLVKYWQSNMNNVHTFQAHNESIRGCRWEQTLDSDCYCAMLTGSTLFLTSCRVSLCFFVCLCLEFCCDVHKSLFSCMIHVLYMYFREREREHIMCCFNTEKKRRNGFF